VDWLVAVHERCVGQVVDDQVPRTGLRAYAATCCRFQELLPQLSVPDRGERVRLPAQVSATRQSARDGGGRKTAGSPGWPGSPRSQPHTGDAPAQRGRRPSLPPLTRISAKPKWLTSDQQKSQTPSAAWPTLRSMNLGSSKPAKAYTVCPAREARDDPGQAHAPRWVGVPR
jgi:hypothetical protein